jgi:hypothetical protein
MTAMSALHHSSKMKPHAMCVKHHLVQEMHFSSTFVRNIHQVAQFPRLRQYLLADETNPHFVMIVLNVHQLAFASVIVYLAQKGPQVSLQRRTSNHTSMFLVANQQLKPF